MFVDQSHSMAFKKCATDLDGAEPDPTGPECDPEPGVDPDAVRYDVVQRWLDTIERRARVDGDDPDKVKVAVLPFSGGLTSRPTRFDERSRFEFLQVPVARAWARQLKEEQRIQMEDPFKGIQQQRMGTTEPQPQMESAKSLIEREIQDLRSKELLEGAKFEFIFITDGVMKPLKLLYEKFMQAANCPTNCTGANRSLLACNSSFDISNDLGSWPFGSPFEYCNVTLPQSFRLTFGDPDVNTVEAVANTIRSMVELPARYQQGKIKVRLVHLFPDRVPAEDQASPDINLFNSLEGQLEDLAEVSKYTLVSDEIPFSIQMRRETQLSYQIDTFLIYNANSFVNEMGELVADSDGDGLSDKKEEELGFNPRVARTDGICLDGIAVQFGCDTGRSCSAFLDLDGDGLNECEENTLNSNPLNADTDGDGLLDFFEAVRNGLNINKDESANSKAGDDSNDHQKFYKGVHPQRPMSTVAGKSMTDYLVSKKGSILSPKGNTLAQYEVRIRNIPVVNTLATGTSEALGVLSRAGAQERHPAATQIGPPGSHAEGINTIYFVSRVVSVENPDNFYWLIYKTDVSVDRSGVDNSLNFDLNKMNQIMHLEFE